MTVHRDSAGRSNRRRWFASAAGAVAGLGSLAARAAPGTLQAPQGDTGAAKGWRFCLNMATIRGQNLPLDQQVTVAIQAGYDGIEPWIQDLQAFQQQGGSLRDLQRRLQDAGMQVESAIGFSPWIVADPQTRASALEQAKREMDLVRQLGGQRIAAPPAGATREALPLSDVAQRYRDLLQVGAEVGVTPQLELWGFSKTLGRLSDVAFVAVEAGRAEACILPDIYHIYRGGSDFSGLAMLAGRSIHVFHINDYPLVPPRESMTDADRVYPGDGQAPLTQVSQILHRNGFQGALSLELFNRNLWKLEPLEVARTGLQKMRASVQQALG